jgi:YtkA-like protein
MKHQDSYNTSCFIFGLTTATLVMSFSPRVVASQSGDQPATTASAHSHAPMHPAPRLQPKRVVTVTGKEDWEALRGFGKDSAMAEMMTLMMVGGSGMEHMKMAPIKKNGARSAGMEMSAMTTGSSSAAGQTGGLSVSASVTPNPPVVGDNTLDFVVTEASSKPATSLKLAATVAMTSMDMGTERPRVVEEPNGHYRVTVNFSMPGPWRVTLTGSSPNRSKTGAVRSTLDFNVGSKGKWGNPPVRR